MREQLEQIRQQALSEMLCAEDLAALDAVRVRVLGKKGDLTAVLKLMGKLSAEERPVMGQIANEVRSELESKLEERKEEIHMVTNRDSETPGKTVVRKNDKIGRNDPCPCGSGLKYKKCCGK